MKRSPAKTSAAKSNPKKETWLKELQGPFLKAVSPSCRKLERAAAALPTCYQEPWTIRIGELIEGSINKVFNLTEDSHKDATMLGILAAQASNCAEMNFLPLLKGKNVTPRLRTGLKKLVNFVSPMQEALGHISRKIMRVMERQPHGARIAFYNGFYRALEKRMFLGVNPIFFETPTTRLYVVLLHLAPWMHQVKSVNHLHGLLYPRLGAVVGSDPKRLEKVCQRIGLKFRKRSKDEQTILDAVAPAGA